MLIILPRGFYRGAQANHRDENEAPIVRAMRRCGAVVDLLPPGGGRPDLLVGFRGQTDVAEVIGPDKEKRYRATCGLSPKQCDWHARWPAKVYRLRTVADGLAMLRGMGARA